MDINAKYHAASMSKAAAYRENIHILKSGGLFAHTDLNI